MKIKEDHQTVFLNSFIFKTITNYSFIITLKIKNLNHVHDK